MTPKPRHTRKPLTTRLMLARRDIARFAALRQHANEEQGGVRQPSRFSLLLIIALTAIAMVAAISAIQLVEAALG